MVADDKADDDDDDEEEEDEDDNDNNVNKDVTELTSSSSTQNLIKLLSMVRNEAVESFVTVVVNERAGVSKTLFPQLQICVYL